MKPPKRMFKAHRRPNTVAATTKDFDANDPRFTAYHEAGHAVACVNCHFNLTSVDIISDILSDGTKACGHTICEGMSFKDMSGIGDEVMPFLVVQIAGPLAEERVNPAIGRDSSHKDFVHIKEAAKLAICQSTRWEGNRRAFDPDELKLNFGKIRAMTEKALQLGHALIDSQWPAVVAVAELLLERTELSGDEVAAIVSTAERSAQ